MTDQSAKNENKAMDNSDDNEIIPQDEHKGPGWFLRITYIAVTAFCLYYLFTYWNWKSSYDEQQAEINKKIMQKNK
jgi:hypothetical protein